MVNLGDRVKDKVTGLVGIVVAKMRYLQGCDRISVQPQELKDGKPVESSWFDEPQLVVLKSHAVKVGAESDSASKPGGPAYLKDPGKDR